MIMQELHLNRSFKKILQLELNIFLKSESYLCDVFLYFLLEEKKSKNEVWENRLIIVVVSHAHDKVIVLRVEDG